MVGTSESLGESERSMLAEEEALLRRVQGRLAELSNRGTGLEAQAERLRELRDEATGARADDLPALLDQMHVVRSVGERRRSGPLPDRACPYFAHLRLREGAEARDYLLGHTTFLDSASGLRIIDWRHAPLSQLFYRYREGDPYEEELPGRHAEGVVEVRRIVVIAEGQLRAVHAPNAVLERPAGTARWIAREGGALPALSGGARSAERGRLGLGVGKSGRLQAPDIAALLDPVQFEIVHANKAEPLLVLGSAGSGKTTVALHRLAALSFGNPERFGPKRLQVTVPEEGLARLARRLLEPLGLGNTNVATFTAWVRREVMHLLPELPRRSLDDAPPAVAKLKRHRALMQALPAWLERKSGPARPSVERLRQELLTDRELLGQVVAAANGELSAYAVDETVQRTLRQADPPSEQAYRDVDPDRLATLDGRKLDEGTPDEVGRTLDAEDDGLLLELWRLTRGPAARRVAHLVLDEAQDMGPFELAALRQALGDRPSATIAGDDVQRLDPASGFAGWDDLLAQLGMPGAARRTLDVGYRCPASIATVAQAILGPLAKPATGGISGRPGAPVGWYRFPSGGAATLFLQDALADLVLREPEASVAVLTRASSAALRWAQDLGHLGARFVRNGDFDFEPGIDVCEVGEAKGLEFDYVVVPDADASSYPFDDDSRRALHVAATRAMHQLWFCTAGTPSAVLPWGREG